MNVIFCPAPAMSNDIYERRIEEIIRTTFQGKVDSLIYHNADNLFDLVCDCDGVVYAETDGKVTQKCATAIGYANNLGKPVYRVDIEKIVKEDK
jgi:hypothetical protein